MSCIICGNPYIVTTDCRCRDCIGIPITWYYRPNYIPINITGGTGLPYRQRFTQDEPISEETEKRFYEKIYKTSL
jgi:hypothetical protein